MQHSVWTQVLRPDTTPNSPTAEHMQTKCWALTASTGAHGSAKDTYSHDAALPLSEAIADVQLCLLLTWCTSFQRVISLSLTP